MRDVYIAVSDLPEQKEMSEWIRDVTRRRQFDVDDYNNQLAVNPKIYSVPTSSTDIIGTEKVGDIASDSGFFYIVVDNAGSLEWRRVGVVSF